jgi:hypothetical protein
MADKVVQPRLALPSSQSSDPEAPKVNWSETDARRRQNIAAGHQRIRDRMRANAPEGQLFDTGDYERKQEPKAPGWGTPHGRPEYPQEEAAKGGEPQHDQGQLFDPDDPRNPSKNWNARPRPQTKLGAMFSDPKVRSQVESISNRWELSNQIRKGGIHAAIRHAVGLPLFPSHKDDFIRARQMHLNTDANTGQNPNHFTASDI